ncbi:MAG: insulinase family protein [Phycisphaerales bacterium]|nr:MAG: insulinase family protein [Phycisphaerales bacterium]
MRQQIMRFVNTTFLSMLTLLASIMPGCATQIKEPAPSAPAAPIAAEVVAKIPARPEQIDFPPLTFEPPNATDYRHVLSNGVPVYLAPSHEFPLIDVSFTFKGGQYLDSPEMVGLAEATGSMMRRGGTTTMSAEDLDEELDFLAAQAQTFCRAQASGANFNSLSSNFDEGFALFMDMVRNPGFQEDRLQIYKDEVIEAMKERNDEPAPILSREWSMLIFGEDHFEARLATEAMIDAITVDDLHEMHDRIFHPGNLIVAVNGDFEINRMLARLEEAFAGWEAGPPAVDPPAPTATYRPGVYYIEKDIPQGRVAAGMRSISRDDPDYFPALVMNDILGGGGFTSRITQRVRTDEGLAYDARSVFTMPVYYPGFFRAGFQTKSSTVAFGLKIVFEEINRIRTEPVSDDELEVAKNSFIETFPRTFESKAGMLRVFVSDEMTGRDPDFWTNYRDNIRAVTKEQIMNVAQRRLSAGEMAILIVGKWADIVHGDPEGRAAMSMFFNGNSTELPLRDPLTLEPLK